jgi:hypothetical protein
LGFTPEENSSTIFPFYLGKAAAYHCKDIKEAEWLIELYKEQCKKED